MSMVLQSGAPLSVMSAAATDIPIAHVHDVVKLLTSRQNTMGDHRARVEIA